MSKKPISKNTLLAILADNRVDDMRQYLDSPKGNANFTIDHVTLLGMAKSKEMAELLIDKGADIHNEYYGYTPFLYQAAGTRAEVMKVIFDKDPSVIYDKDPRGWNALHLSVRHPFKESLECAEFLLNAKIDINAKTTGGYTALDITMMSRNVATERIIKLLIDKGINTILHKDTARLPNAELVKRFVKEKMERERLTYNQAYRGLAGKIPENVVGINIKGFIEGPVAPGQGRPEYPSRSVSRKSRKSLKRKSRKSRKN